MRDLTVDFYVLQNVTFLALAEDISFRGILSVMPDCYPDEDNGNHGRRRGSGQADNEEDEDLIKKFTMALASKGTLTCEPATETSLVS